MPLPTFPAAPEARDELISIVTALSYQSGPEIKLASGQTSTIYFNMKPTMLDARGAFLIGLLVLDTIEDLQVSLVGGLEMGAVPIASAVAAVSAAKGDPVSAFFVRKQVKEHGTQSLIEGLAPDETMEERRVVILEDVTTTGGSAVKAAQAVREAGGEVVAVVTILDRQEGAQMAFNKASIAFRPLLTKADILAAAG
ncbi:MAG: orotate phosphoribosyltransferase [Alphaproteobacteria bacterium]|nr:orotate phosphoribosyltransferase [Alphaproteobacteria bacterium]